VSDDHSASHGIELPIREQFLERTIVEFGQAGPGAFNPGKIARDLGVTVAMINHYFGSRYGLISEAAYVVYARYIDEMFEAITNAPRVPEERLRAWIQTQIAVARRVGAWGMVLNYPTLALKESLGLDPKYRTLMSAKFEVNLGRLAQLVLDVKSGSVSPTEITEDSDDFREFLSNPTLVALGSSIAMSTLGAAVWMAGSHAPSADSEDAHQRAEFIVQAHIDHLIQQVKNYDLGKGATTSQ
jgi:AcrR family transcriptional regulator